MTVFVLLIAVTQAAYAVTRAIPFVPEGYDPSLVGAWAGALMLLVLFFLLVRTATLYDRALRKQYAGRRGRTPAALPAVQRSLLGGDGRVRAALPAAAAFVAGRGAAGPVSE